MEADSTHSERIVEALHQAVNVWMIACLVDIDSPMPCGVSRGCRTGRAGTFGQVPARTFRTSSKSAALIAS
ncbi:MAG: hypothetical protein WCB93_02410 [Gallionella sp.]